MAQGRRRKSESEFLAAAFTWALVALEREIAEGRERLATLTSQAEQLRARVGGARPAAAVAAAEPVRRRRRRRRRTMSAEGRKRLSEMMTRRWAERRKKKVA